MGQLPRKPNIQAHMHCAVLHKTQSQKDTWCSIKRQSATPSSDLDLRLYERQKEKPKSPTERKGETYITYRKKMGNLHHLQKENGKPTSPTERKWGNPNHLQKGKPKSPTERETQITYRKGNPNHLQKEMGKPKSPTERKDINARPKSTSYLKLSTRFEPWISSPLDQHRNKPGSTSSPANLSQLWSFEEKRSGECCTDTIKARKLGSLREQSYVWLTHTRLST